MADWRMAGDPNRALKVCGFDRCIGGSRCDRVSGVRRASGFPRWPRPVSPPQAPDADPV